MYKFYCNIKSNKKIACDKTSQLIQTNTAFKRQYKQIVKRV